MTENERVEAMSNAELCAYLEETQPTPAVLELIKRAKVEEEIPKPAKSTCEFCGGSGRVGLGTPCMHHTDDKE